ncbi:CD82 antigen, partial [Nibea albiflora]
MFVFLINDSRGVTVRPEDPPGGLQDLPGGLQGVSRQKLKLRELDPPEKNLLQNRTRTGTHKRLKREMKLEVKIQLLKFCSQVLNTIFLVLGLSVAGCAFWILFDHGSLQTVLPSGNWLLLIGGLVVLVSLIGCVGADRENRFLLLTYMASLIVLVLGQLFVTLLLLINRNKIEQTLDQTLKQFILQYGRSSDSQDRLMDNVQTKGKCCGITDPSDWLQNSHIQSLNLTNPDVLPCSCFSSFNQSSNSSWCSELQDFMSPQYGRGNYSYDQGCNETFYDWLQENALTIVSMDIGLIFIQTGHCRFRGSVAVFTVRLDTAGSEVLLLCSLLDWTLPVQRFCLVEAWILTLTSACVFLVAALLVQTPPSVSVTLGSKVSLSCDITGMGGSCSQVVWLHFGQVSGLRVISRFIPGAQTWTLKSEHLCQLETSSAALRDAGRYYCVFINELMLLTAGGTTLTITEPLLLSPVVHLLVPSDRRVHSSRPVPLICLASGLEDTSRVTVDWEVDRNDAPPELCPRILPESETGVIGVQVYVPGETWARGAEVSCVLTDGELQVRQTVSSRTGECVFPTSIMGAVCVVLSVVTVTLGILLSWQRRRLSEY